MGFLEADSNLKKIEFHALQSLSQNIAVATLFSSRSVIYFMTGDYESNQLTMYTWKNSSLKTIQIIENDFAIISRQSNFLYKVNSFTHNYVISLPFLHWKCNIPFVVNFFFACAQLLKSLWCSMQFQCKCSSHLYRLNCRCSLQLYQTFCTPFSSWIQFCNSVQYFLSLFFGTVQKKITS